MSGYGTQATRSFPEAGRALDVLEVGDTGASIVFGEHRPHVLAIPDAHPDVLFGLGRVPVLVGVTQDSGATRDRHLVEQDASALASAYRPCQHRRQNERRHLQAVAAKLDGRAMPP